MMVLPIIAFPQFRDLPNPPANQQILPGGSYVIAMDNTNQVNNAGDFNLKSYGLVVFLLNHNKKLKWIITAGKMKDGIDFSVVAAKIKPSLVSESMQVYNFKAGPFVLFAPDTAGVCGMVDSFYYNPTGATTAKSLMGNDRPSIYRTLTDVVVDIRYDLY